MNADELKKVLDSHRKWMNNDGGERANLRGANLSGADLSDANLTGANLYGANLSGADLTEANLSGADLSDANLTEANLRGANLSGADLTGANLSCAYLYGANLTGANLTDIKLTNAVGGNHRIQCLQIDPYKIIVLDNEIAWGGCTKKTVKEWLSYKGEDLSESDRYYLTKITKPFIRICIAKRKES